MVNLLCYHGDDQQTKQNLTNEERDKIYNLDDYY